MSPHPVFPQPLAARIGDLPVCDILPELFATLARTSNAVLAAPPGAGKTTLVPLALLARQPEWLGREGRILLVEPRRVAVRGAAGRMADLLGEKPGGTIGFRTRPESAVSARTRIEVITEGLLVRRLLDDPLLEGVEAVIFDEVHERSLDGDTGLALCLDLQRHFRPALRLLAMSATLDSAIFTQGLALPGERGPEGVGLQPAPLIESAGQLFPVETRHGPDVLAGGGSSGARGPGGRHASKAPHLPEACAAAVRQAWGEEEGSILAFLPGLGEIRRTQALLQDLPVFPLYGEQNLEEQNRALDPQVGRRIVLATSIAETSLTVPGVRVVIDGGWRRKPERDPGTGLSRLRTRRISRATAAQRAGRAGRQGPGITVRLWSEMTQRALPVQEKPAIGEADLADFALVTAAWEKIMGTPPEQLPMLEAAPTGTLAAGRSLLQKLGALDGQGQLSPLGERMLRFGTHPRLAAMLCAARTPQEHVVAACLASLLDERDPLRAPASASSGGRSEAGVDIVERLKLFSPDPLLRQSAGGGAVPVPRHVLQRLKEGAQRYWRRGGRQEKALDFSLLDSLLRQEEGGNTGTQPADRPGSDIVGRLIAAGFPDYLGLRNGEGRYRLAGGGSASLGLRDPLSREKMLACAALHVGKGTAITLAAPLSPDRLPPAVQAQVTHRREGAFDGVTGRVVIRDRQSLGALVLQDRNVRATPDEALPWLLSQAAGALETALPWTEAARQFQARVALARQLGTQSGGKQESVLASLPDLSDEALSRTLEGEDSWLAPYLAGCDSMGQLQELDLLNILRARLDHGQLSALEPCCPARISLKNTTLAVDYTASVPTVSARAQIFYGTTSLPRIGGQPLQVVLLSPAGRPQAITADLARFWQEGWSDMRRDMRGRYPKHAWPENPALAQPPSRPRRE
ncbi:ATP-dependent helicase HrpB [Oecophyllibacter saccharovorans]|uniref:ATP-dependent helicase HrpB n=1 Tax=Oecophyllibacter saccharovorans TaxID=2558360 RepID=UPI0011432367|nr:ATP-dependent helicase HrpB [Oecophyllibacter saccharovorans]QDH14916.1 ATP-dependent helicase HrpB [Oecophyllibacter saccharovorans]